MDIEETLAKENCASEIECNKSPEGEPDKGVKPSTIVALEILKEFKYNWFALVAYFQPEFSRQGYIPKKILTTFWWASQVSYIILD
jgi:hypothetical protein